MANQKSRERAPITDADILAYDNVPVPIAAQYIGWNANKLYYALQDRQVPFGFVAEQESSARACGASWTYNISPGLLVAYKRGTLVTIPRGDLAAIIRDVMRSGQ